MATAAAKPSASRPSHSQPLFSTQTPLQTPSLPPSQLSTFRQGLKRRRSSYPPSSTPSSSSGQFLSWTIGGTPQSGFEPLPTYAVEEGQQDDLDSRNQKTGTKGRKSDPPPWTSEPTWESLLNFDGKFTPASPRNNPLSPKPLPPRKMMSSEAGPSSRPFLHGTGVVPPPSMSPSKIAQLGQDLAWKTILASMVDVEGVGEIGVAKLLHEVWKRGGGDLVTNQCLWPSIIMSLSLSTPDGYQSDHRIPTPSAHAALALQQLYNLTLRHWEPSIFTGLLAQFASISTTPPPAFPSGETPIYGAATPTKELDLSQWTNLTPGFDWSTVLNGVGPSVTADPFDFHHPDPREDLVGEQRRSSRAEDDDQARGIDELLAAMEEGRELHERQESQLQKQVQEVLSPGPTHTPTRTPAPAPVTTLDKPVKSNSTDTYLPTPETDSSESPAIHTTRQNSFTAGSDQAASPHVTACSYQSAVTTSSAISTVSKALSTGNGNGSSRAAHPTSLSIPVNSFVPPPPMCMFFNPSFKDITQGKLGVWKGELEVKGQSGGRFSILIIGEQGTENIWQAPTWGSEISYPPPAMPQAGANFTSTMTPVSHLAREGYVPAAMAMVLCNDPDVTAFCSMVQGLHQEGVAFHLPNPRKLPLMFLPAKFDSNDGLQRLGLAYMTKAGAPALTSSLVPSSTAAKTTTTETAKKRKRRQSAPAQAAFKGAASRVVGEEAPTTTTVGRPKKRISIGLPKVEEDSEKP